MSEKLVVETVGWKC